MKAWSEGDAVLSILTRSASEEPGPDDDPCCEGRSFSSAGLKGRFYQPRAKPGGRGGEEARLCRSPLILFYDELQIENDFGPVPQIILASAGIILFLLVSWWSFLLF